MNRSIYHRFRAYWGRRKGNNAPHPKSNDFTLARVNRISGRIVPRIYGKRVTNIWNDMPPDTVDFTSLTHLKKSSMRVDITARKHFVYLSVSYYHV